jgi:N-acetylneuraminic acid mutarotase
LSWAAALALGGLLAPGCDGSSMAPGAPPGAGPPPLTQGHWEARPDMPGPSRTYTGVAAVGPLLFVAGGFAQTPGTTSASFFDTVTAFDTRTSTWATIDPLPRAMSGANMAGVGGTLYVLGGLGVVDCYAYDVAQRRWSPLPPLPVSRGHGMAAMGVQGTRILMAGGAQPGQSGNNLNTGVRVADALAFDTTTAKWDRLPDLDVARGYAMGAVVGTTFWVIGGSSDFARTDEVLALDLTTRTWSNGPPPPLTLSSAGAAVLGGRIYVMGGVATSSGTIGPLTLVLDPAGPSWDMVAPLNTPRFATGAATIDGRIYFPGGVALIAAPATFSPVGTLEVFVP